MASIPRGVGVMDPGKARRLADAIRKTCCGLVGGEGCRIRAVGILTMANRCSREEFEAGEMPRVGSILI